MHNISNNKRMYVTLKHLHKNNVSNIRIKNERLCYNIRTTMKIQKNYSQFQIKLKRQNVEFIHLNFTRLV